MLWTEVLMYPFPTPTGGIGSEAGASIPGGFIGDTDSYGGFIGDTDSLMGC